ncbi:MAG TPA: DPP IV N-terminal domain-containing protein [Longimicrobiales bacterium]|nr:DPP IV N-terminal domain-containing protein [Longimicrobiales bacterium]
MQQRTWRQLAAAVLLAGAASAGAAQTPDYHRAEQFLGWNSTLMVAGDVVAPNWLDDGNRFWYRNKTGAGTEFMLVDPTTNVQRPVFDHARLAAAMSLAKDTAYEPHKLPFTTFNFEKARPNVIAFNAARRRWSCDIQAYRCTHGDTLVNVQRYVGSPDSVWEVFASGHNLWLRHKGASDSTQLTTDGELYWSYGVSAPRPNQLQRGTPPLPRAQVRWSPDSRKLAVYRTDERNVEHMHYISYTPQRPRHFSQPYALPGDTIIPKPNIHIIDIETKQNIALQLNPVPTQLQLGGSPLDSMWSRDSRRIHFSYLTRGSKSMHLVEADAMTGAVRIVTGDSAKTWVETNPQGRPSWMVTDDGADAIWWSERDGWPHLYRFDARTGALRNQITAGAWAVGDVLHIDQPRRIIYFTGRGREHGLWYHARLYRVNFDGTGLTLLTPEDANHNVRVSPSGRYVVDTFSSFDGPPVTVLRSLADGRVLSTLETADISRLAEIGWAPGRVFSVKARDGVTDLYGVMWLPSHLDPTRKYPVIEYIYPGPQVGSVGQWSWNSGSENKALAELGFIVVQLDHLGTPLRSKAFHDNYYGNFIDNGIPDHIAGLKQLAARYPFIDLNRVGIYGHSGGGFASTDAILRFPDFYKVAVSTAGNHDNRSYNIYWAEKYQGLLKRDTVRRTDNFENSANRTYAKQLQGKLLLMHGDMDDNVHPAMTVQLVDELIKANRDFDLIWVPNRNHGLNEPYVIRRRWDYFVRHLLGVEPPRGYTIAPAPGGGGPGGPDPENCLQYDYVMGLCVYR